MEKIRIPCKRCNKQIPQDKLSVEGYCYVCSDALKHIHLKESDSALALEDTTVKGQLNHFNGDWVLRLLVVLVIGACMALLWQAGAWVVHYAKDASAASERLNEAFEDGYDSGYSDGKIDGTMQFRIPTRDELYSLAVDKVSVSAEDERQRWIDGYIAGYKHGYRDAAKPAF